MELKDIVLKKGDIVYLKSGAVIFVNPEMNRICASMFGNEVLKIERPVKYETIYEAPKEILDKEEKEYLEAVIRPFRDRIKCIKKITTRNVAPYTEEEFIAIFLDKEAITLPFFKKDTRYKGMELEKEYTLDELGLFKE